jgi:hypothetical protein
VSEAARSPARRISSAREAEQVLHRWVPAHEPAVERPAYDGIGRRLDDRGEAKGLLFRPGARDRLREHVRNGDEEVDFTLPEAALAGRGHLDRAQERAVHPDRRGHAADRLVVRENRRPREPWIRVEIPRDHRLADEQSVSGLRSRATADHGATDHPAVPAAPGPEEQDISAGTQLEDPREVRLQRARGELRGLVEQCRLRRIHERELPQAPRQSPA